MAGIAPIGMSELALRPANLGALESLRPPKQGEEVPEVPFLDVMKNALASTNAASQQSKAMTEAFASGRLDDIHGTMIAAKEASIQTRLLANVRSKFVEAFQELWRMQV